MAVDGCDGIDGRRRGRREKGEEPLSKNQVFSLGVESECGLTRDGMAEPVSRGQILRRERDKE